MYLLHPIMSFNHLHVYLYLYYIIFLHVSIVIFISIYLSFSMSHGFVACDGLEVGLHILHTLALSINKYLSLTSTVNCCTQLYQKTKDTDRVSGCLFRRLFCWHNIACSPMMVIVLCCVTNSQYFKRLYYVHVVSKLQYFMKCLVIDESSWILIQLSANIYKPSPYCGRGIGNSIPINQYFPKTSVQFSVKDDRFLSFFFWP